jgi:methionyl-tRNA synthetase
MKLPFLSSTGIVYCDKCGRKLDLTRIKVEEEKLTNDRVGYFFRCSHCEMKYTFASLTNRGMMLQHSLKKARQDVYKAIGNEKKYPVVLSRYEKLLSLYQKEVGGPYSDGEVVVNGR